MLIVEKLQTRPNKNIPFWSTELIADNSEYQQHFYENYVSKGKFLSGETQVSGNELELRTTTAWISKEAADEYLNDPVVKLNVFDKKVKYLEENGITEELTKYELI
jgi:hypothetical protein